MNAYPASQNASPWGSGIPPWQVGSPQPPPHKPTNSVLLDDLLQIRVTQGKDARNNLDELKRRYTHSSDSRIEQCLLTYPNVANVLLEAAPILHLYFGAALVRLRVLYDESGVATLYAVVLWAGEVGAVAEALEKFDEEWCLPRLRRTAGRLTFTYELV